MADTQWWVTNVQARKKWSAQTETVGPVVSGDNLYFTTKNGDLVDELKKKVPGILATPTGDQRLNGRKSWVMPEMPWKRKEEDKPDG